MNGNSGVSGGCDVTLYWIQSQRDPTAQIASYEQQVLRRCREAAAEHAMDLRLVTVDEIITGQRDTTCDVWIGGKRITSDSAFFHTKLLSWPAYRADIWRHLTTYGVLEAAGFCLTVPALHSIINNDKLLSVLSYPQADIRILPTVRLCTREIDPRRVDLGIWDLDFPVIVKPSSWGSGMGVLRADNAATLAAVLQLAGASELTMVVQPWLGPDVVDYRIYCVNGEPYSALLRRPAAAGLVSNVQHGGSAEIIELPPELVGPARGVALATGLPYLCVDFLRSGEDFWFSEIEMDGGTGTGGPELTKARFGAYRGLFDAFVADRTAQKRWRYA